MSFGLMAPLICPVNRLIMGCAWLRSDDDVSVDLTRFGAANFGVSRRHASVLIEAGDVFLVDLNSTNGTRLNGKAARPGQPYRLRDGDEIEFAHLRCTIRLLDAQR